MWHLAHPPEHDSNRVFLLFLPHPGNLNQVNDKRSVCIVFIDHLSMSNGRLSGTYRHMSLSIQQVVSIVLDKCRGCSISTSFERENPEFYTYLLGKESGLANHKLSQLKWGKSLTVYVDFLKLNFQPSSVASENRPDAIAGKDLHHLAKSTRSSIKTLSWYGRSITLVFDSSYCRFLAI